MPLAPHYCICDFTLFFFFSLLCLCASLALLAFIQFTWRIQFGRRNVSLNCNNLVILKLAFYGGINNQISVYAATVILDQEESILRVLRGNVFCKRLHLNYGGKHLNGFQERQSLYSTTAISGIEDFMICCLQHQGFDTCHDWTNLSAILNIVVHYDTNLHFWIRM